MKVGIIGATGKAGRLIAKEAYDRGHEITAIVIDPEHIDNPSYTVLNKNVFDLTVDDVKDFDVVINCFGVFDPAKLIQHQTSMLTLISIFEQLPDVRFMMIGGAASLYTDESKEKLVLETIPEDWAGVPKNMLKGFEALKASDMKNWTYFSPAGTFDPEGERTGSYTIGDNDVAILNEDGESYISYADYAVAMVDEMENKKYICKRITAVSRRAKKEEEAPAVPAGPPQPVDVKGNPVQFEGLSQYRGPFNYELAGQSFQLVMDNGYDYIVKFLDGETLEWAEKGKPFQWENYDCLKSDETTYLINLEMFGRTPRTGLTLVLDLEQRLVTAIIARQGTNPKFPTMVTNEIIFGAIKLQGKSLPKKRHGFTADLVGTRINWKYNPWMAVTHVYFDAHYIRVGERPDTPPERLAAMRENPYDEPCYYIKIKKNIYLISFIEENMVRRGHTGNNMLVLMDTARLHDVGRSFGLGGTGAPENYMFAAVGSWEEANDDVETRPSKYRV